MKFRLGQYQQGSPHESDAGWPIEVIDPFFGTKRVAFVIEGDLEDKVSKWIAEHIVQNLNDMRSTMLHQLIQKE